MKKVFTLLIMLLATLMSVNAERVVIFEGDNNVHLTVIPLPLHQDGVTLSIYGTVWPEGLHMYGGHESSLSVVDGKIVHVVFEHQGSTTFTFSSGSYSVQGENGYWTGNERFLSFVPSNDVVVHRIIVTVEDNKAASPTISPSSGTYYNPIEVSISCRTPGATIHYTTDGTAPDTLSPVYTAPFSVNHDMMVKAIAALDGEVSDIASAVYTIPNLPPFDRLEDLVPLDNDTQVRFTSPVYALAQHNKYLYVKDDSGGYALIWGNTGQTYNTGDVIPAGFVVTKSFYSGEMELKSPYVFQPASGNVPIEPETITPGQQGHDWFGHYVIIKNVHIVNEDGKYVAVDSLGNQIPIYFGTLGFPVPEDLSQPYDITGIIGSFGQQTSYRLLPTNVTPSGPEPMRIGLGNYWEHYDPVNPPEESITFDYDATVILQTGSYLYAKDETGYGLIYGNVGQTYKHGDVFPAGYGGKVTIYQDFPELTQPFHGFQPAKGRVDVVPEEVTIPQVNPDLWAHYVIFKQVYLDPIKGVIRDMYGNELPIYIRPGLPFTYPDDLSKPIDVRGLLTYYHGQPQLLVWEEQIPIPVVCLQDCYDLENSSKPFSIKLIVIYQSGAYLYVKDLCGEYILMYGNIGQQFVNGDTIEGVARFTTYQQHLQLSPEGDWVKVAPGPPVEPEDVGCTEEVSQDMCHWYVRFENVKIVTEEGNTYIEDECGRLLLFNRFQIQIPDPFEPSVTPPYDLNHDGEVTIADINYLIDIILSGAVEYDWTWTPQSDLTGERTYDVQGFLSVYKNELEFIPLTIEITGWSKVIVGDLNNDHEVNVADLNSLVNYILGEIRGLK